MKKFHLMNGLATAVLAVSLVAFGGITAHADTVDQADVSQETTETTEDAATLATATPTFGAPTASIKEQTASGQVTTSWTFTVTAPTYTTSSGTTTHPTVHYVVYNKGDYTEADYGYVYQDDLGQYIPSPYSSYLYDDDYSSTASTYEWTLSASSLKPGTKEVYFYVYDSAAWETDNNAANQISKAGYIYKSAPITITVSMEGSVSTTVTSTSVTLSMYESDATGFEIRKKVGKKYKVIERTASKTYTDKGLTSGTTYTYKVRPYYVNTKTGAKTYGKYTIVQATTKGSALKLKAKLGKKNKVTLSWTKVKGATEYEVYRYDTSSNTSKVSKGESNSFASYQLLKTVSKSKKKYVDKKTSSNTDYTYVVRAVVKDSTGKKTYQISETVYVSTSFGSITVTASYTDSKGNKTLEWRKVNGATGYLVEKYAYDATKNTYDWKTVKKLGSGTTKYQFKADGVYNADGTLHDTELQYRIRAMKGSNTYSEEYKVYTEKTAGVVKKVTAKATTNGIKVSWTSVSGAAYYRVYRVKAGTLTKNSDLGGYANSGTQVTEYVGATTPKQVDVASWNAAYDAGQAYKKLDTDTTYYYQNYSYSRSVFPAGTTSIVDYSGDIYRGSYYTSTETWSVANGFAVPTDNDGDGVAVDYYYDPVVEADEVMENVGPQAGVTYQYYVVAYFATANTTAADYLAEDETKTIGGTSYPIDPSYKTTMAAYNMSVTGPQTSKTAYATTATYVNTSYCYRGAVTSTAAVKTVGKASYTATKKVTKKATIKSLTASKTTVTLKLKKKVKGAKGYKIYRSTKKKGSYTCVGTTTKKTFKDTVEKGKTYYYKVVPYTINEANAMVEGKASKVKSIKVN